MLTLFHGSDKIIERPYYGGSRDNNDYGNGFYCSEITGLCLTRINSPPCEIKKRVACIQKQLSLFILIPECIRTISCIVK